MVSEATLTFILGSVITLVSTLGTLLVQSFVNRRDKDKDRIYEQTEKLNGEIFSPLLFYLFEEAECLSIMAGNIIGFSQVESSEENQETLMEDVKKAISQSKTEPIKQILLNKIAFIKPIRFRRELFLYFQLISIYEKFLIELSSTGLHKSALDKEKKWLKNLEIASLALAEKTNLFVFFIDNMIHKREKGIGDSIVFDKDDFATIANLIMSRNQILVNG